MILGEAIGCQWLACDDCIVLNVHPARNGLNLQSDCLISRIRDFTWTRVIRSGSASACESMPP